MSWWSDFAAAVGMAAAVTEDPPDEPIPPVVTVEIPAPVVVQRWEDGTLPLTLMAQWDGMPWWVQVGQTHGDTDRVAFTPPENRVFWTVAKVSDGERWSRWSNVVRYQPAVEVEPTPVPEPSVLAGLVVGCGVLSLMARRSPVTASREWVAQDKYRRHVSTKNR